MDAGFWTSVLKSAQHQKIRLIFVEADFPLSATDYSVYKERHLDLILAEVKMPSLSTDRIVCGHSPQYWD